jgi:hypothetical protein
MKRALLLVAGLTLLSAMVLPIDVSAQGRGRGKQNSNLGKKCEKFVNCHDARDGRWDNRGPRSRNRLSDRYYSPYSRNRIRNRRIERRDRIYVQRNRNRRY